MRWKREGKSWSIEEEEEFKAPIQNQYEEQGNPYYATARLWDDGIVDPLETRRVLALGLAAAQNAPIRARRVSASSACENSNYV